MGSSTKYADLATPDPAFAPMIPQVKAQFDTLWDLPIEDIRKAFSSAPLALPKSTPTEFKVDHQNVVVSDGSEREIRIYTPTSRSKVARPLFFVIHGGGWAVGTHDVEEGMNRFVCVKNDVIVVSVDYRMAPEHPFPIPFNDCYDVLKKVISNPSHYSINPKEIIVGGGSAGGNIAAAIALRARDEGLGGIIGQVLNIPVTCHPKLFPVEKYEYNSYVQNKDAPVVDEKKLLRLWDQYLPHIEPNIYASPLLSSSFSNLPSALVQVAGLDPLRDEGIAYAEALKAAGIPVTLKLYPGLPHGFFMFPDLEATVQYYDAVVDFINPLIANDIK